MSASVRSAPLSRSVPQQAFSTGMVSPMNAFTGGDGRLTPVAFRFLWDVFNAASALQRQIDQTTSNLAATNTSVAALQGQLNAANGAIATLQGQVSTLQGQVATISGQVTALQAEDANLQGQITTINNRLAAAGIP